MKKFIVAENQKFRVDVNGVVVCVYIETLFGEEEQRV